MPEIKLFVCCHKICALPKHRLLAPIQVGTALAEERFSDILHDDDGANISERNRSYCELTAQYWAWKNSDADYLGFFHYRRFLYPDPGARYAYRIENAFDETLLKKYGFDRFPGLIEQYDLIAPMGEDMHVSIRDHYAAAPFHRGSDLCRMEAILREREPAYMEAAERYLSGTLHYFGSIFIMNRPTFHRYCAWLFPLLEEFDRRTDTSDYSAQEKRVDGYLAERLFGIFYTYHRNHLSSLELPRVILEPDPIKRWAKQMETALLPPGSKRRADIKALLKNR